VADTRADVVIPKTVWTDLYAASGIVVGTAVTIWNKGSNTCNLAVKATAPTDTRGTPLFTDSEGNNISLTSGESGLWAYSDRGTILMIQEFN
jgi:hypothetical protein